MATQIDLSPRATHTPSRIGYTLTIVIDIVMLIVVQSILTWGWLPFLTTEFAEVVPWISLSLVVTILVNVVYLFDDSRVVKSSGQIAANVVSMLATYQIWKVFPFDFTSSAFNWDVVFRVVLVLAIVGAGIGAVTETINLVRAKREKARNL